MNKVKLQVLPGFTNRLCSGGGIYTLQQVKGNSDNENSFVNKIYK